MTNPFSYLETFNILNNFIDEKYIIKNILDDVIDMEVYENKKTLLKELTKNNVLIIINNNKVKYKRGQEKEVFYEDMNYIFDNNSSNTTLFNKLENLSITTNENNLTINIENFGYFNKVLLNYY